MTTSSLPPSRQERRAAARREVKAQQRARRTGRGQHVALALGAAATVATGFSVTNLAPASAVPTLSVTSIADTTDPGTLRWAIQSANADPDLDVIGFDLAGSGLRAITLTSALPTITQGVTIEGPGSADLAIDGAGYFRPFLIQNSSTTTPIDVTISGVTVRNGHASGSGGGIDVVDEHLTLTDSVVSGNYASADGGGIAVQTTGHAALDASSTVVSGNNAYSYGGGIAIEGNYPSVTQSTSVIDGVTVSGNGANVAGGIAVRFVSGTTITRSTVSGNTADNSGGGILAQRTGRYYDALSIDNSTVSGNTADNVGSGVYVLSGTGTRNADVNIRHTTVADNHGDQALRARSDTKVSMAFSIVSGNDTTTDVYGAGSNIWSIYNLLGNVAAGAISNAGHTAVGQDADLGPLAVDPSSTNGTATMRPSATSLAVDHGISSGGGTDQRGLPRLVGGLTDLGAVELQAAVDAPTLTLDEASDTGASATDGITSASSIAFTAAGDGFDQRRVALLRDGVEVAHRVGAGALVDGTVTTDDTYVYTVAADVDREIPGEGVTVTVDTTAPAAPSVPDLAASSDNGTSDTDDLTNATTRTFQLAGAEDGATLTLRQAHMTMSCFPMPFPPYTPICMPSTQYQSVSRDGDGPVDESFAPGGPSATYDARQTDVAGNTSPYSSALAVSFDFAPPAVPDAPDLQASSDDGSSATDNQTTRTSLTFDVTGIDSGATATLIRSDGQSGGEVATRVGNGPITDTDVPLGEHTYSVVAMDAAGNEAFDGTRSIVVTVVAPVAATPPSFTPPTTTTTPPTTTPPTTEAPPPATAPATASNPTPRAGETVQLQTPAPAGGSTPGGTASTIDGTKPSSAILLSTNGSADRPMPQPVITKQADGSTSISVQVPADTPPGVYLIAVVGTTPSGQNRVIIVPVVVRRTNVAPARTASVKASTASVPATARTIQASITALGGSAAVAQAVVEDGATLSIAGDRLIVDSHPAQGDSPAGPAAIVGLLLGAAALFRRTTRMNRSAR